MKIAQLAVLGVAVAAGGAAFMLMGGGDAPQAPVEIVKASASIETDDVLVAAKEIPFGGVVTDADIQWQTWPRKNVPPGVIRKSESASAVEDVKGSVVRGQFGMGEPIRRERLVKGANTAFMSSILPSGARAVAINIDSQGSTSAGGFILPNDRVDVLRTYRDEEASRAGQGDVFVTQTLLKNVRVLAIGQTVQEKNGEKVVVGSNATLELDPRQAEMITLAQRVGQLSLTLRSMMDANKPEVVINDDSDRTMTVVRFGVQNSARGR